MREAARRCWLVAHVLLLAAWSVQAAAQEAAQEAVRETVREPAQAAERQRGFGLSAGFGQSDNIERDPIDPLRSSFYFVGMDFDLAKNSRRVQGSLSGDVELRRYSDLETADDGEALGSLDGTLSLGIVPSRFLFDLAANGGQARSDPLEAGSPSNRERIRVLSAGPQLDLPLGGRTSLQLGGTESKRTYEKSTSLDGTTTLVDLGLFRSLSPVTRVGIEFSSNDIEYDDPLNPGYTFRTVYLSYDKRFASGGFEARLGSGEVDTGGDTESQPVGSLRWDRDVGTRSRLAAWLSNELTDAGIAFQNGSVPGGELFAGTDDLVINNVNDDRLNDIALSPDPMERSSIGVEFTVDGQRTTFSASVNASRDDFDGAADGAENKRSAAGIDVARALSSRWTVSLSAGAGRERLAAAPSDEFRDHTARLSATRLFGENAALQVGAQRNRRDGNSESTDENVYVVSLRYALAP